jgi:hypothetical protein
MQKKGILEAQWRLRLFKKLDIVLILFELILSGIFLSLSYITSSLYLKGIGVGLIIAWVTSGIAYLLKKKAK